VLPETKKSGLTWFFPNTLFKSEETLVFNALTALSTASIFFEASALSPNPASHQSLKADIKDLKESKSEPVGREMDSVVQSIQAFIPIKKLNRVQSFFPA
jgi:hypothetical protein